MDAVRKHFRPEFLNRIDEIILFQRLGREQMDSIVKIQLQRVEKLLADRRMAHPRSTPAPCTGWPSAATTRSMARGRCKRVIQKELIDPIARKLLAGELEDGSVIDVTPATTGSKSARCW